MAGRLSDAMVIRWRRKRAGVWVPEDRLRACLPGAILAPLATLVSGLATAYISGPLGLSINLVALFLNGIGVDVTLSPASAYFVDVLHIRSAEVVSATKYVS
jgi:hypothetical protein